MESSALCRATGNTPADVCLWKSFRSTVAVEDGMPSEDDEGEFFDLVFTLPEENFGEETYGMKEGDGDEELIFTRSSPKNGKLRSLFSSDDLFFLRRRVVPGNQKPQLHVAGAKPAAGFRFFALGPRKLKSPAQDSDALKKQSGYFVKYRVGEVPDGSHFAGKDSKEAVPPEEKKSTISKAVVNKYFGKIRPLYVRVSRRYAEKLGMFSDEKEAARVELPASKTGEKSQTPAIPARLLLACKSLGKSKSSSSAASTASSPQRCEESLLMQQDGIQSAIAHCKRSLNDSSKDTESSLLQRSKSDPWTGSECLKSPEEGKSGDVSLTSSLESSPLLPL